MVNIGPDVAAAKRLMAQIQGGQTEKKPAAKDGSQLATKPQSTFIGKREDVMGIKDLPLDFWRNQSGVVNVTINNIGTQNNVSTTGDNVTVVTGDNNRTQVDNKQTNNNQKTHNTTNNHYNNGWGWGPYYPPALPPIKPADPVYLGPPIQVGDITPPDELQLIGAPPLPQGKAYRATLNTNADLAIVKDDRDEAEVVEEVAASTDVA